MSARVMLTAVMKGFHVNGGSINDDMGIKSSQKLHLMSNKNDDVGAP